MWLPEPQTRTKVRLVMCLFIVTTFFRVFSGFEKVLILHHFLIPPLPPIMYYISHPPFNLLPCTSLQRHSTPLNGKHLLPLLPVLICFQCICKVPFTYLNHFGKKGHNIGAPAIETRGQLLL